MSRFDPQELLERFDYRLHEYATEIKELRAAQVSEHRIHALYPSSDDYTARLSQALSDSKVHAKVRRIFTPSASVLPMNQITFELKRELPSEQPLHGPAIKHSNVALIHMSEKLTSTLVSQLQREHPKTYREPNSAHAFASMIYIIPIVLPVLGAHSDVHFSQHSPAPGGRLEIEREDFFWRVNELLLALG